MRAGGRRHRLGSGALVLALAVVAASCGGSEDAGDASSWPALDPTASTASTAPGDGSAAAPVTSTCADQPIGGRAVIVCRPEDGREASLVVALHGRGSSAADMRAMTGLDQVAAAAGMAVAYPESLDGGWGDDTFTSPQRPTGREDVDYLDALLAELRADPQIADGPVGVVGFSNGASMALRFAVERPDDVRAVVSVAGQLPRDPAVTPRSAVPLLQVYGSADPVRSHDDGIPTASPRQPGGPTPTLPTADTVAAFVAVAGAPSEPTTSEDSDPVPDDGTSLRTQQWVADDGTTTVLLTIVDGGHTWPSARTAPPDDFGLVSRDVDATVAAVDFLT